jgi:hypothetical protein
MSPPEPPRVLAAVLTPVQPATEAPATEDQTHGRALGHLKQQAAAAPAATDTAVVQPLEAQGQAWGHTKPRATPDGD